MATVRQHHRISRPPDEVWKVVSDPGAISLWFPGIDDVVVSGTTRTCTMGGSAKLVEEIVTNDDDLRRFQYRITDAPFPLDFHLATVDVLEDGEGSLVIYSTEMEPGDGAPMMAAAFRNALQGLQQHLEA